MHRLLEIGTMGRGCLGTVAQRTRSADELDAGTHSGDVPGQARMVDRGGKALFETGGETFHMA